MPISSGLMKENELKQVDPTNWKPVSRNVHPSLNSEVLRSLYVIGMINYTD